MTTHRPDPQEASNRVGRSLRQLRELRGMTQRQLAAKAELAPSALSRYESGTHRMRFDTLERLLRALQCDFMDLGRVMARQDGEPLSDLENADSSLGAPSDPRVWNVVIDSLVARILKLSEQETDLKRRSEELRRETEALRNQRDELLKALQETQDPKPT